LEIALDQIRTTPLDTSRPAPDLLEDLLTGIYACALLYREFEQDRDEEEEVEAFNLDEVDDVVGSMVAEADIGSDDEGDGNDLDDDEDSDWPELASPSFLAAVRAQAAATADQLL
jgi:hypothetical protein